MVITGSHTRYWAPSPLLCLFQFFLIPFLSLLARLTFISLCAVAGSELMHLKHRVLLGTYSVIACAFFILLQQRQQQQFHFYAKRHFCPWLFFRKDFFFFNSPRWTHGNPVNAHCEIEWPNGHDLVAFHGWKVDGR